MGFPLGSSELAFTLPVGTLVAGEGLEPPFPRI